MNRLPLIPALSALILALCFILPTGTASAATANFGFDHDGGPHDINTGPGIAAVGGNVVVSLVIEIPPESLGAWRFDVQYDDRVFAADTCSAHSGGVCNAAFASDVVRLSGASLPGLTGVVDLLDISFDAIGSAGQCSQLSVDGATLILTDDSAPPGPFPLDFNPSLGKICIDGTVGAVGIDHDAAPLDINAGPATVSAGGSTTTVQLVAETPPPQLGAWEIDIDYDPSVIQPTACSSHPTGPGASVCNPSFAPSTIRVVGADISGTVVGTFNLADITFEAVGTANSCSPLTISVGIFTDASLPLPIHYMPEVFDGQICVVAASADVDGDGDVDGRDVARIAFRAIFGPYAPRFDLNADQAINLQDVFLALQQWFDSRFG